MKLKTCYPQTLTRSLLRHGKKLLVFYQKETCGTWAASVLSSFFENYSPGWLLECIYRYIDIYSCEKKSIVSFPVNFLIFLITLSFLSFVLGFTRFPTLMNQKEKKFPFSKHEKWSKMNSYMPQVYTRNSFLLLLFKLLSIALILLYIYFALPFI